MTVVTRFAPSPTGFLHIGGARTALFNWLFARHFDGQFLLRIEDTDRKRSTPEAVEAILDGLSWLGLDWDGEAVMQFDRIARHAEVANEMLANGTAYKCYCTPEELAEMREKARAEGKARMYDGRWRDRDPKEAPPGVDPVIRLRAPLTGETVIDDLVQGEVRVANEQLDDMVLLRSDGTPTYMLSVVVDDHDMGVTHVIRGDDHLNNAFRQLQVFRAMGWSEPAFAHIPLIHGADGAKLSKRHGALGVDAYRDMGYLPAALRNYLLRLGWSHGDDEVISTEQAIEWFGLEAVGKSPARFDFDKLAHLNGHYLRNSDVGELADQVLAAAETQLGQQPHPDAKARLEQALSSLTERAKTVPELVDMAKFLVISGPLEFEDKALKLLDEDAKSRLAEFANVLEETAFWTEADVEALTRRFAEDQAIKLGQIAQPLRAALTGSTRSPGIFEVMVFLGKDSCIERIRAV